MVGGRRGGGRRRTRRIAAEPGQHDRLQPAFRVAYRYLNRREWTTAEVRERLVGHGVEPELADAVIEELVAQGAIDDTRFARLFVQDKRTLEQWGTERIRRGLEARGLHQELIEQALEAEEVCDDPTASDGEPADGELDRALALLRRRFPAPPRERRERERALGVLVRKGYEYELALEAIRSHSGSGTR